MKFCSGPRARCDEQHRQGPSSPKTTGSGSAALFQIENSASIGQAVRVLHDGISNGVHVELTSTSNAARTIDVIQRGPRPGVFSVSDGGNGVWGTSNFFGGTGVIGDNNRGGGAVTGRNRGCFIGNHELRAGCDLGGRGAVTGRNDGYGSVSAASSSALL